MKKLLLGICFNVLSPFSFFAFSESVSERATNAGASLVITAPTATSILTVTGGPNATGALNVKNHFSRYGGLVDTALLQRERAQPEKGLRLQIFVLDARGVEVSGATVQLSNGWSTQTNDLGLAVFQQLKAGSYDLVITCIGYERSVHKIQLTASTELQFSLTQSGLLLQPIEIKAVRASSKAPFSQTTLSKKQIEANNLGRDLPFLIQQTPGVVVNSDAGNGVGYTSWRIRGSDVTRVNMTINGIPYNDAESQGTFFVNLPDFASSVNNVQIQRGVGTSSNGAGAFGASVNFSTNEFNEKAYGEVNSSAGSFNTFKNTIKLGSGLLNDHFTIDARLSQITSDGFVDRASSNLKSAYLSAAWFEKNASLRFNLITGQEKTYQSWNGLPESLLTTNRRFNSVGTEKPGEPYENETDNYQQDHYQFFYNQNLGKNWKLNTALFLTRGRGYYEQYKADEAYSDYNLSNPVVNGQELEETDLIRQLWLDNYFYGGTYSLQYQGKRSELVIGGGMNQYDGAHFGKVIWAENAIQPGYTWYDYDAVKKDFSTFVKWQFEIAPKLIPGLYTFTDVQYRYVQYDIEGFRNNPGVSAFNIYRFVNPKAGVSYVRNGWTAFASYAIGQKEPNRDDFEVPQQETPQHERLNNIEVGGKYQTKNYMLGVNLYHMDYVNQLVPTGKINDVGAFTRVNVRDSYRMGMEWEAAVTVNSWLSISGNYARSRNRVKNVTQFYDNYDDPNFEQIPEFIRRGNIAFSPTDVASFQATIQPVRGLTIALPGKYVSRQYLDNSSRVERSLDDFYVQDLQLSYQLSQKLARSITLYFHVYNVFNRQYEPNGYTFSYQAGGTFTTENYFYPMAGTNVMGGISLKF